MSKKETEFDRYDRMKRLVREAEVQKRKNFGFSDNQKLKKGGKPKSYDDVLNKKWSGQFAELDEELDDLELMKI